MYFMCSVPCIKVNLSSMCKPKNMHLWTYYISHLFLAPTCFVHCVIIFVMFHDINVKSTAEIT